MPVEHKCHICYKVLTRSTILRDHLRSHKGDKIHECSKCGKAFVRNSDRKDHELTHTKHYKYVCRKTNEDGTAWGCGAKFHRKYDLDRHWKRKGGAKCLLQSRPEDLVSEELQSVNAARALVGLVTSSHENTVERSLSRNEASSRSIDVMSKLADTQDRSPTSSSAGNRIPIPPISRQPSPRTNIQEHSSALANPQQLLQQIDSSECPEADTERQPLSPKTATQDCSLDLTDLYRSSSSSSSTHKPKNLRLFRCHLCRESFTLAHNLHSHLLNHTDVRPWTCDKCGKTFARRQDLNRHAITYHGRNQYVCLGKLDSRPGLYWGCGRTFPSAEALARHFKAEEGRVCIKPLLDEEVAARIRPTNDVRQANNGQDPSTADAEQLDSPFHSPFLRPVAGFIGSDMPGTFLDRYHESPRLIPLLADIFSENDL